MIEELGFKMHFFLDFGFGHYNSIARKVDFFSLHIFFNYFEHRFRDRNQLSDVKILREQITTFSKTTCNFFSFHIVPRCVCLPRNPDR